MKGVVLCAGYAKRMWPLTLETPKPLLPVGEKPIVEYILERLRDIEEIKDVVISTNLRFEDKFKEWLTYLRFPKPIRLLIEETREEKKKLGSVGSLNFIINKAEIDEDSLVIGGDNLFDFDLRNLISFFKEKKKTCLLLYDMKDKDRVKKKYGVLELDNTGRIIEFQEKPEEPNSTLISTACYLFTRDDLRLIKRYLEEGNSPDQMGFFISWLKDRSRIYGLKFEGSWFDIGSFEEYDRAKEAYGKGLV
ncbi:MAG: nucleotidyltransferase family protein [bacterium]|nr:nucleotidyltransferase family protein [bacterium]